MVAGLVARGELVWVVLSCPRLSSHRRPNVGKKLDQSHGELDSEDLQVKACSSTRQRVNTSAPLHESPLEARIACLYLISSKINWIIGAFGGGLRQNLFGLPAVSTGLM